MKRRGKVITSILVILGLVIGGGTWWVKKNLFDNPMSSQVDPSTGKTIRAFNVLLLESDARPNEKKGRTDTIIVAQVSKDRISLLSIPRDTRVDIPGHGKQKINAAAMFDGPELTAKLVSDVIGQPVDKYILVRWEGFMQIVDALGGVDVNVPKKFVSYSLDGQENRVDFQKGPQHLNGKQALAYVRYRKEAQGDIYRVGQQLEFMKELVEQSKQPATLLKLPKLVPELYNNVETNVDLKEMIVLAKAGMTFKESTLLTQTLPGYFLNIDGISYWGIDPVQSRQVVNDLFFNGLTTDKVVMETPYDQRPTVSQKQPQQVAQKQEKEEKIPREEPVPLPEEETTIIIKNPETEPQDPVDNDDKRAQTDSVDPPTPPTENS